MNDNKSCNELSLRRNSFSDRFCDDLSEVLLSFASFEDKLRFECVSHQFQRLIDNKQYVLQVFDSRLKTQNSLNLLLIENEVNGSLIKEIDLKAFESVLKKCKFINKIIINNGDIDCQNSERVLQLITKYVKHLKSIEFDFKDINEKVLLQFGEKCGQNLENIDFNSYYFDYNYKPLLKLCPNIRSLTDITLFDMIENNDLLVPKLMSVKRLYIEFDNNLFETFINKTENTLKCLGINLYKFMDNTSHILTSNLISYMNLEELYLDINLIFDSESIKSLEVFFHNIGINCKKINKLYVYISEDSIEAINAQNYILFKTFTQLKHLSLNFCNDFTLKSLKDCKQLTHLCLELSEEFKDIFTDIHLYLPQLTHIRCHFGWDISKDELK